MKFSPFILMSVFILVLGVSSSFAQKMTEQFKKPMPQFDLMPLEEFEAGSTTISEDTLEDESLHFTIRIPENWSETNTGGLGAAALTANVITDFRKFFGPPSLDARSRLEIGASSLQYNMTAEQWLIQYLLATGYNLQGMDVKSRDRADALYVLIEDNVSYAVRASAHINGKNVLFAEHFVPVQRWHDEKFLQQRVLDSFKPLVEIKAFVEDMSEYQFLDLAAFQYPSSWKLRALPIRSVDRMKVELLNASGFEDEYGKVQKRLDGQIDLNMVSIYVSENLEDEIEQFREVLGEKGLVMGEVIETRDDFFLGDTYDFVDTQVYKAVDERSNLVDHELWLTIMAAGDYYYFVSLFTPSRDKEYAIWARNLETYKLITTLIEPKGPSGLYDGEEDQAE